MSIMLAALLSGSTAESALAASRRLTAVDAEGCARYQARDEIVVCGTRPEDRRQRLPYPAEHGTPEGARQRTGALAAGDASRIDVGSCGTLSTDSCGGGISILSAVPLIVKGVAKLVDPDADVEPARPVPRAR